MSIGDVFLLAVRWLHLVSAAAWVGGSLFYLVVMRPALRRSAEPSPGSSPSIEPSKVINAAVASEFRALVDTCIFVLLATGIILTFNRLTANVVGVPYVVTLGVKIVLSLWMFALARGRRFRAAPLDAGPADASDAAKWQRLFRAVSGYNAIVLLGIVVFLLSDLLKVLFELALSPK